MGESPHSGAALVLLAQAFRERRSGVLSLGRSGQALHVALRDGHVSGVRLPRPLAPSRAPLPGADDSSRLKLDRVLAEIGIRPDAPRAPKTDDDATSLRERLVRAIVDGRDCAFEEGATPPEGNAAVAGATEPLLLEALARLHGDPGLRDAIGDLDRRLAVPVSLSEERTLTMTEGCILSRVDGVVSGREILELVPLDRGEAERTLLGLLLTGRLELRHPLPRIVSRTADAEVEQPSVTPTPAVEPDDPPETEGRRGEGTSADSSPTEAEAEPEDSTRPDTSSPEVSPGLDETPPASVPALNPETVAQRREILDLFQALPLRDHFEVLGVERGCGDADVKRAYIALAKRFHPDVYHDPALADLSDVLEAVFIRIGEAWEVLEHTASRNAYAARPSQPRPSAATPPSSGGRHADAAPHAWVPPEETLMNAQLLIAQARYWDAIQLLEGAIPHMEPARHRTRGRILLARAYAKNPNWMRRAEEMLQTVLRDDPANADAHYELGLLYKAGGLAARAQAMFRRAVELRPEHREAAAELGGEAPAPGGLLKRLFGRGKAS